MGQYNESLNIMSVDYSKFGTLRVGLEIHQQLATKNKLFCNCKIRDSHDFDLIFERKLHPRSSEMGTLDAAAEFESKIAKIVKYQTSDDFACLVEADEEPPHPLNREALEIVISVALALNCKIVDNLYVMRKIVIDGSNTTGFQRTILVARNGNLEIDKNKIGIYSICLEEDAARITKDEENNRNYSLDRLGVPLIEITTEPILGPPEFISKVALEIGRLLRSTKKVIRGIGSIRQDVNVSINDGQVVEVKGVQQLSNLQKIIEYEMIRQKGLTQIASKLASKKLDSELLKSVNISDIFTNSSSNIINKILETKGHTLIGIPLKGFKGMLGFEPYPGIRLGKELGELVKLYSIGGIFHSDELPNYGITDSNISEIFDKLEIDSHTDAFILIGGNGEILPIVASGLIKRIEQSLSGVVAETRAATMQAKTLFIRPRAGSARMYPETDIPPIEINDYLLEKIKHSIPLSWNKIVDSVSKKYNINTTLAENIYDSRYYDIFEKISNTTSLPHSFIASKLTEDMTNFERQGYDLAKLNDSTIVEIFQRVHTATLAKESVPIIFEKILRGESDNVNHAITLLGIKPLNDSQIEQAINEIILENRVLVTEKGDRAMGLLMGRCMSVFRGKVDGAKINSILEKKLNKFSLEQKNDSTKSK